MTHLQQGALLQGGKYRIEKILGQGGFGITYLGWHVSLNSRVAVKEFFMKDHCDRNPGTHQVTMGTSGSRELVLRFREKFIKEARHIYVLSHPHIVRVIDVFEENGTAYYVMEYLGGGTLQDVVQAYGALSVSVASGYIRQVASALDYIHGRNLLHLDVKPSNIMLNDSGEAVLVDFGVSKRYDESGHQTSSTPLGVSEGYAPIEQYESGGMDQFSPSTDIYSLGATFYYLLTGSRPPKASALLSESLSFPDGIPEGIRTCIVRSIAPGRKNRPQSVGEFLRLLETTVRGSGRKSVKDEETVPDAVVVEPEVSKSGKFFGSGKASVSGRTSLRKWLISVAICFLVGLCVYLFFGGKTENSGTFFSGTFPLSSFSLDKTESSLISSGTGGINGHDYVDLGLSVKWATCNVGASYPEDYGSYYAWGEIQTKPEYNSLTYAYVDVNGISGNSRYDVASAQWGSSWRLPTFTEIEELQNLCKWEWITIGGHEGYRVVGPNGNSIFLPAAGYRRGSDILCQDTFCAYWSGSGTSDPYGVFPRYLGVYKDTLNFRFCSCSDGLSVRPVSQLKEF